MRNNTIEVGTKVREIRKKMGFSMKQLAQKLGINFLTIHRIETGKVSPSVALLSEIAYHLNYSISSFLAEERPVILIKGNEQPIIEGNKLKLKILAHKGTLHEDFSVTFGEAEKGEFISKHKNKGVELAYIMRGKLIFKYGHKEYELNEGDLIYHDGKDWHSATALEPSEFLNIHFLNK